MFYFLLDVTSPGMIGGPVFDRDGFVVGIHGRGSADKGNIVRKNCSYDPTLVNNLVLASGKLESNDFYIHYINQYPLFHFLALCFIFKTVIKAAAFNQLKILYASNIIRYSCASLC